MSRKTEQDSNQEKDDNYGICGIVMPISTIDGCSEAHWLDVKRILEKAVQKASMTASLVSDGDDIAIIQKRIIQNLYSNPIVVCDVSGKNPNVMFELGMRLAFDKPTIIVKDDKTSYSFDTGSIEHLTYPRDLRFSQINEFIDKLSEKLTSMQKSVQLGAFNSFLQEFGQFKVASLSETELPFEKFVVEEIQSLKTYLSNISSIKGNKEIPNADLAYVNASNFGEIKVELDGQTKNNLDFARKLISSYKGTISTSFNRRPNGSLLATVKYDKNILDDKSLDNLVLELLRNDDPTF